MVERSDQVTLKLPKSRFAGMHSHDIALETARPWEEQGLLLLRNARLLVGNLTFSSHDGVPLGAIAPALLLRGFGIENLLKGLYILNGNKLKDGKKSGDIPGCGPHDLLAMAKAAKCPPQCDARRSQSDEVVSLTTVRDCAVWAGRYPIPRSKGVKGSAGWSGEYEGSLCNYLRRLVDLLQGTGAGTDERMSSYIDLRLVAIGQSHRAWHDARRREYEAQQEQEQRAKAAKGGNTNRT